MGDCVLTPAAIYQFASKDTNRIAGTIATDWIHDSPFSDILDGGTMPANFSEVVRSVVQENAVTHASLARPVFTATVEMCGVSGGEDKLGTTEYQYRLESLRGEGPRVCVKKMYNDFKGSYITAQGSLSHVITKITNADIRALLFDRSGLKFVARDDIAFSSLLTGGVQAIDTAFYPANPNSAMTFKALRTLGSRMRYNYMVKPWGSDRGMMWKVIAGDEQIERFRNELDVKEDLLALVKGRYKIGEESIDSFTFMGPYRGFAFAVDPVPLRSTGIITVGPDAGKFALVEPEIQQATTNGFRAVPNPTWLTAPYEVGFIVGKESFRRLVPERFTGEGTFRFNPQMALGELYWHYQKDNDCNKFGDFGQHLYEITRAYRPERPHAILAFIYKRCDYDLGLDSCATSSTGL